MMYLRYLAAGLALALLGAQPAAADTLLVTAVKREASVPRPYGGMTMTEVQQKYGAPREKLAAVGNPPITRWVYARYVVYFERNRVIHAVVIHH
jgi:hypothetical protein